MRGPDIRVTGHGPGPATDQWSCDIYNMIVLIFLHPGIRNFNRQFDTVKQNLSSSVSASLTHTTNHQLADSASRKPGRRQDTP